MKRRYKTIFLVLLLLTPPASLFGIEKQEEIISQSQREADNSFAATKWHPKHYFALGTGFSGFASISNTEQNKSIAGIHLYTALGYWIFDAVGLELGAIISFGYFHDITVTQYLEEPDGSLSKQILEDFNGLMWDSSFFWGVMVRWPFTRCTDNINFYLKLFQGYGTSVYWILDNKEKFLHEDATRFFSEGILFGFSIGNIFNAFNKKTTWFIQLSMYMKMYQESIAIKDGGVLPETLAKAENRNNSHLVQIILTVGIRLY